MTKTMSTMIVIVMLTTAGWGQSLFEVQVKGKQQWPAESEPSLLVSMFGSATRVRWGSCNPPAVHPRSGGRPG